MALSVSGYSNTISSLFSNLSTSSKSSSASSDMLSINYSDYASIKSGSYYKLLKQYYASDASSTTTDGSTTKKATNEQIQTSASSLSKATDKLMATGDKSLFKEVTKKDKDGNETTGYDVDKIASAIQSFVDAYNDMVDKAGSSSASGITTAAASMVNYSTVNSRLLDSIGITIDSDNKLSFDKDEFEKADMSTVKSLFQGRGSYGYTVGVQASMINYAAESQSKMTYSKGGTYNYSGSSNNMYSASI
ncbi:MAG: flagellar filament capping protein FliD [Lachnospiraceae bacterium]|nr:flagellar filament capping protein FliD [Lachnospiraceae bacterium]